VATSPLIVHVNAHTIRKNRKLGLRAPPIVVRRRSTRYKPVYTEKVDIVVGGRVVGCVTYTPDKPLSCGAVVYVQLDPELVTLEYSKIVVRSACDLVDANTTATERN
jgi:hypothetical protein